MSHNFSKIIEEERTDSSLNIREAWHDAALSTGNCKALEALDNKVQPEEVQQQTEDVSEELKALSDKLLEIARKPEVLREDSKGDRSQPKSEGNVREQVKDVTQELLYKHQVYSPEYRLAIKKLKEIRQETKRLNDKIHDILVVLGEVS